ncbi:photosynthetic protein synthase I [Elizabethkingia meningoseptica]|uniref:SCO family protein n=1 Tax=Elizabethkingia meningoseptica TaxID=238 RepID=UPI000332CFA5|nr:SCO family protein [Elizabethkingia meningoseptica]AQX06229.1 photosynthetic protein synthase I [Elizabethkingia meningoseptica]AQX48276.1 photosynthetic protein synthase I [Elizabethkingia meningoseptica]EOR29363.1 electron transporter SCO1/SenC [Elizabethkingia meningoseptica ATCC 13253 = NBRC 12535]KUY16361.1 photosynthetic protein synthase I [Elizabethkingia meningoseptica]MDE5429865.1 SCO family protein [Elizabethkingia meningoseptica]
MKNKTKKKQQQSSKAKVVIPLIILAVVFVTIGLGIGYFKKDLYTVMKVPAFELTDQNNKKITDKDMLGKVYLVEFFYSRCPTICPIMNSNMRHIEDQINNPDFGIISISIDPTNDTSEVLKNHARMIGAKSPNWHFLTGDRDYIGKIADQFNIYVGDKEDDAESLNHSGMIALVDEKGNIRCRYGKDGMPILYYSGLNYEDPEGKVTKLNGKYHPDRELLIEDIKKLLK